MADLILGNARIVTEDEVFAGSVAVEDGMIAAIDRGTGLVPGAFDCEGDIVVPGLVELHTDNLDRHVTPRPKVRWHAGSALMAHDAQMAAAGITTVFDALAVGDIIDGSSRMATLRDMVAAVTAGVASGYLRAEHRLHLRCEVSTATAVEMFTSLADNPLVGIVSLMDHTPGQRQFVHEEQYRTYFMGKYGFSHAEMDEFSRHQRDNADRFSGLHRRAIAALARDRGFTLASHDDATADHVAEAAELGTRLAEFPTTIAAAKASRTAGMAVMMGAPNLIRGGSHSGNIAAADLAAAGDLDLLSSDYVPVSLLAAAFRLHQGPLGFSLPAAINTVSRNPARTAGLDDRGVVAVGKRADLVRVRATDEMPIVREVWRSGRRVA